MDAGPNQGADLKYVSKWLLGAVAVVVVAGLAVAGATLLGDDDTGATPTTQPLTVQPIADGEWFSFVTVGEDETGAVTLGIDMAEMLDGDEAKAAAVADGVIAPGEDLPNDFYISNPEEVLELLHVSDDARFTMLSGADPGEKIVVDAPVLASLYNGTYTGEPVYGVVAGTPIAMDVTVNDGLVTGASAVYLP